MDSPFLFQWWFVFSSFFSVIVNSLLLESRFPALNFVNALRTTQRFSVHSRSNQGFPLILPFVTVLFIQSPASLTALLNTLTAASASTLISSVAYVKSADTSIVKKHVIILCLISIPYILLYFYFCLSFDRKSLLPTSSSSSYTGLCFDSVLGITTRRVIK